MKIEYAQLKAMGASEEVLNVYSTTDPLTITKDRNGFTVTGVVEYACETEADLLEFLASFAE